MSSYRVIRLSWRLQFGNRRLYLGTPSDTTRTGTPAKQLCVYARPTMSKLLFSVFKHVVTTHLVRVPA